MMSDPGRPADPTPTPPAVPPAPEQRAPEPQPPQPQPPAASQPAAPEERRPEKPPRERPARDRSAPVPSLEHEQSYGSGKRIEAFDEEVERELQEAMGGLSDKDLYGEPEKRGGRRPAEEGPKKGKVFRLHGPDVFIDLPGGRTQGVLPLAQFPEGPPALGTEVEVTIEGFDQANGVLLLTRRGAAVQADWESVAPGMTVEARVTATNKG